MIIVCINYQRIIVKKVLQCSSIFQIDKYINLPFGFMLQKIRLD